MTDKSPRGFLLDRDNLPRSFPTHHHSAAFWESLGRAVGTFGALEESLAKAIFALTGTRPYSESEAKKEYADWVLKLQRALSDPLRGLIDTYGKAVRDYHVELVTDLEALLDDLKAASDLRNILCHGSWGFPDAGGASVPFFVNRKQELFKTAMGCEYLDQVQRHVSDLICSVMDTVTCSGLQFPGSSGPGTPVWEEG